MPHVMRLTDWEFLDLRMATSCMTLLVAPTGVVRGWKKLKSIRLLIFVYFFSA